MLWSYILDRDGELGGGCNFKYYGYVGLIGKVIFE